MTIFSESGFTGSHQRLVNAQASALAQLASIHSGTTDLRWAMIELAWRSFTAMCAFAQGRLLSRARGHHRAREEQGAGRPCCC